MATIDTRLELADRIQRIAAPVIMGAAIGVGVIVSFVEIRRENVRHKRWALPKLVVGGLLLLGLVSGITESVVNSAPSLRCINGTYASTGGVQTCRAVFASGVPAGATARCSDGAYSFTTGAGACSAHGGVAAQL